MRSAAVFGLMAAVVLPLKAQVCGHSAAPEVVVQAQVDAYNAHDMEKFVQCYADDITIRDLSSGRSPAPMSSNYAFLAPDATGERFVKPHY